MPKKDAFLRSRGVGMGGEAIGGVGGGGGGGAGGLYSCFFVANCTCSRYTLLLQRNRDNEDTAVTLFPLSKSLSLSLSLSPPLLISLYPPSIPPPLLLPPSPRLSLVSFSPSLSPLPPPHISPSLSLFVARRNLNNAGQWGKIWTQL